MFNTQLTGLLKSFSVYEINRFGKFVISPFFNKNNKVISLFKELRKYYPAFDESGVKKERLYKKLFGNKTYNDKKIRDVTYELLKLAEEFIGITMYQSRKHHYPELDILTGLGEKGNKNLFEKRASAFEKKMDIYSCSHSVFFYNKWVSCNTKLRYRYFFYGKQLDAMQLREEGEALIMMVLVNLSYVFYNLSTASHAGNSTANSSIINGFIKSVNLEEICAAARAENHKYADVIEVYYCMIMMLTREEEENFFFRLKGIMNNLKQAMVREDIFNVYVNLTAYCVRKIMKGKNEFHRFELDIYKDQLKNNAYYIRDDDKSLSPVIYHNILLLSFELGELNWAGKFISGYIDKLIPEERENMLNYSYAYLNLEKKKFNKALEYISKINTEQFYLKYEIRYLLLKTHFELKNYETVLSLIDSSLHFLNKNKLASLQRRENFKNFLRFLKKLLKLKSNFDPDSAEKLTKSIMVENTVSQKDWLLEKTRELRQIL